MTELRIVFGALFVDNSASSAPCPGIDIDIDIDIVKITLRNPAGATFLHRVPTGRNCHYTGVILGSAGTARS